MLKWTQDRSPHQFKVDLVETMIAVIVSLMEDADNQQEWKRLKAHLEVVRNYRKKLAN